MVTQQVKQGHGQVLAGGDRAPAADGVKAHGDAALWHQVGILAAVQRQCPHAGITALNRVLVDFLLGGEGVVAQKIDGEVELLLAAAARQHVFDGTDQALGLQVAAAQAKGAGV